MRSKFTVTDALLVTMVFIAYLSFTNKLDLYIHPRYIVFTTVMVIVGIVVFFLSPRHSHAHAESGRTLSLGSIPLLIVIVAALLLPARTLTSSTVSQRVTDSNSLVRTSESAPIDTLFAGSSKGLGIVDWSRLLFTNKDPSYYTNKTATVSGFVYDADLGSDTVWLARFVLTCCAVDAQPVGLPVHIENWPDQFEQDQWIEAEGIFTLQMTDQGEQLVLTPERVTPIDEPENPYARR